MLRINVIALIAVLTTLSAPAFAQEVTAGGALNAQASWTALQNMLNATNGNVSLLRTDMDAIKACFNQGKIWKQGTGCIKAASDLDTTLYDAMVACGDQGMVYDKSAKSCVATAPSRWSFLKLAPYTGSSNFINYHTTAQIKQRDAGLLNAHKEFGPYCTAAKLSLATCSASEKGNTCFTMRNASKNCTGGDGNSGACNAQYDGYVEVFKCI